MAHEKPRQSTVGRYVVTLLRVADGWEVSVIDRDRSRPRRRYSRISEHYATAVYRYYSLVRKYRDEDRARRQAYPSRKTQASVN